MTYKTYASATLREMDATMEDLLSDMEQDGFAYAGWCPDSYDSDECIYIFKERRKKGK